MAQWLTTLVAIVGGAVAVVAWLSLHANLPYHQRHLAGVIAICVFVVVVVVALLLFLRLTRGIRPPPAAVTRGYAVKIRRAGRDLLSRSWVLDVLFLNPTYAAGFVVINMEDDPRLDGKDLKSGAG